MAMGGMVQPHPMGIDPAIEEEIGEARASQMRGELEENPLDAHRRLNRLKVAGVLAVLDNRHDITLDDWHLAGTLVDTSDGVRDHCRTAVARIAEDRENAYRANAVGRDAAVEAAQDTRHLHNAAEIVARRARRDGGPINRRQIRDTLGKRYRDLVGIDVVIDRCIADGTLVAVDGKTWTAGGRS
jgi:hypothetical protein